MEKLKAYYEAQAVSQPESSLIIESAIIQKKPKSKTVRTALLIAAVVASLSITALATDVIPELADTLQGIVKRIQNEGFVATEYEQDMFPHDIAGQELWAVMSVDDTIKEHFVFEILDSLEEAQEILGVPLLVPTYLENGEEPHIIRKGSNTTGTMIDIYYFYGYIEQTTGVSVSLGNGAFFILAQEYVGDKKVIIDFVPNDYREHIIETKINGVEAIWMPGDQVDEVDGNERNGALMWIQNGVYIFLGPCDLDFDYVLKIAESLAPMTPQP